MSPTAPSERPLPSPPHVQCLPSRKPSPPIPRPSALPSVAQSHLYDPTTRQAPPTPLPQISPNLYAAYLPKVGDYTPSPPGNTTATGTPATPAPPHRCLIPARGPTTPHACSRQTPNFFSPNDRHPHSIESSGYIQRIPIQTLALPSDTGISSPGNCSGSVIEPAGRPATGRPPRPRGGQSAPLPPHTRGGNRPSPSPHVISRHAANETNR